MKNLIFAVNIGIVLCFAAYSQTTDNKITPQEKQEVEKFVDSFIKSYTQTLDLTKTSQKIFARDYKKFNNLFFLKDKFGDSLDDKENFQNYSALLDLLNAVFSDLLVKNDFNLERMTEYIKKEDSGNSDKIFGMIFSEKIIQLLQNHPKAKIFFYNSEFSQIKTVEDYRAATKDFRNFVDEVRKNISPKQREDFQFFLTKNKDKLFISSYKFNCSKENCEGFPEKTKMIYYESIPLSFLLAEVNGEYKIVKIQPPTN